MVDRYWREIEDIKNDIENAMQISSILLKLKGYDNKLDDLSKINDNTSSISSNSDQIDSNINAIKLVNKNSRDNRADISINSGQIDNIKNDLSDFKINYSIQNLFIYNIDIEQNYTLNKDNPKFSIFSYNLEDDFKSNSILEVNCKILYNYTSYNNIGTLIHIFKLYDKDNKLIYEYKNLKSNSGDNLSAYLNQNDLFYVELNDNYSIIKIELILSILDNISKSVSCKLLNTFKSNFLYVKHYKKINTLSINNNLTDLENDISSNLTKIKNNLININTNEDNIATNLEEINYLKNSNSKSYLKNVYNFLPFYDYDDYDANNEKSRIPVNRLFFTKTFKMNIKKNDFIELNLRMFLEYETLDNAHIVDTLIKFFDDDERIYFIKYRNGNFLAYDKFVFLNNNVIYHFKKDTENLKIEIRFEYNSLIFSLGVDKIWQISRNTIDQWIFLLKKG